MTAQDQQRGATRPILILYASQTGNAQDVAELVAREATRRHYHPRVISTASYETTSLPLEPVVLFVASTTGQGDPPDSFKQMWRFMLKKSLPNTSLANVHYAVFGLGDSGYIKFNVVARRLDKRLGDLGGKQLLPIGLGDDQHASGYEAALDPWLSRLWKSLVALLPLPEGLTEPPGDQLASSLGAPKFQVTYVAPPPGASMAASGPGAVAAARAAAAGAVDAAEGTGAAAGSESPGEGPSYRPAQPFIARVQRNERLTAEAHFQEVRHLEVGLGPGMAYQPGDSLAIWPQTPDAAIDAFLLRTRLDGDAYVRVRAGAAEGGAGEGPAMRVREVVAGALDVCSAPPRRYFFEVLSHFASEEREIDRLQYFASPEGRDDLYRYCNRERRTVLEVLDDFPSALPPLEWLLSVCPRLRPRYFSISSSPAAHPGCAHLTVAVVEWTTPFKRQRRGLCTDWLSSLKEGAELAVWVEAGSLRLPPSPETPLILVGPGTGIAPMRAFAQERAVQQRRAGGAGAGPACVFFGCRGRSSDFLYEDEWKAFAQEGGGGGTSAPANTFSVAFSRDQEKKVYVTDRIREHAAEVWGLLQRGACVYVSGAAGKMPRDVAAALEWVAEHQGPMPPEEAKLYLRRLEARQRYQVETWG